MSKIRVAVVQAGSVAFDAEKTFQKLEKLTAEAAKNGAKLVLFPEAFISCYPRGSNFGALVGNRSKEGREQFQRYWESSVDVPGPIVDRLSAVARDKKVHLVVGVIEREGGTLYCCVLFFSDNGDFLGKHRKLTPTGTERCVWGCGDGSTMPVFDTSLGKLGAVICWENYMPLLRMTMYSKGIQIYCAPTADHREEWNATMRHIALEGRCFVLGCNQVTRRSDFPKDFTAPGYDESFPKDANGDFVMSRGGSCIYSPLGVLLAGPIYDEETTLYADLDMGEIVRGKYDFDVVGHYARPDIFTLNVNEKAKKTTVVISDKETEKPFQKHEVARDE